MKSLKNVYRNLFEFDSRSSRETSVDAKVSLTLPGVGTFEITPLQSILIARTMQLFINEADIKKALTRSVEASNDDVVKDSENLIAASKQYFNSFSLLESQDESRYSAPALRTLVNENGEVLPTLIKRAAASTNSSNSYASGYGYFTECLRLYYIYTEHTDGNKGCFTTTGDITEFKGSLRLKQVKFFVIVYRIINNIKYTSDNSTENISRELADIQKQYNDYKVESFEKVYASIRSKNDSIFAEMKTKLKEFHSALITKLNLNSDVRLSIKVPDSPRQIGYDFLVKLNLTTIGFVNCKSSETKVITSSYFKFLKEIINDHNINNQYFFLSVFSITNSSNLLSKTEKTASKILFQTEITSISEIMDANDLDKARKNKTIEDNFNESDWEESKLKRVKVKTITQNTIESYEKILDDIIEQYSELSNVEYIKSNEWSTEEDKFSLFKLINEVIISLLEESYSIDEIEELLTTDADSYLEVSVKDKISDIKKYNYMGVSFDENKFKQKQNKQENNKIIFNIRQKRKNDNSKIKNRDLKKFNHGYINKEIDGKITSPSERITLAEEINKLVDEIIEDYISKSEERDTIEIREELRSGIKNKFKSNPLFNMDIFTKRNQLKRYNKKLKNKRFNIKPLTVSEKVEKKLFAIPEEGMRRSAFFASFLGTTAESNNNWEENANKYRNAIGSFKNDIIAENCIQFVYNFNFLVNNLENRLKISKDKSIKIDLLTDGTFIKSLDDIINKLSDYISCNISKLSALAFKHLKKPDAYIANLKTYNSMKDANQIKFREEIEHERIYTIIVNCSNDNAKNNYLRMLKAINPDMNADKIKALEASIKQVASGVPPDNTDTRAPSDEETTEGP